MRVLILGGGPAGSSTAISILARRPDAEVYIVERKNGPRSVCAGGLGFEALRFVDHVIGVPPAFVEHIIELFEIAFGDESFLFTCDDFGLKMLGVIIDRKGFDRYLLGKAEEIGAKIVHRKPNLFFDYIVDARGVEAVLKYVPKEHLDICLQWFVPGRVSHPMIFFNHRFLKYGYVWFFPTVNYVKVGFGRSLTEKPVNPVKYFVEPLGYFHFEGKLLPLYKPLPLVSGKVLRVGTAACLVCPVSGAGIKYAIESGVKAGEAIAEYSPGKYVRLMRKTVCELKFRYGVKKVITPFTGDVENLLVKLLRKYEPKTSSIGREVLRLLVNVFKIKPEFGIKIFYNIVRALI